jgi:hypothetical protein
MMVAASASSTLMTSLRSGCPVRLDQCQQPTLPEHAHLQGNPVPICSPRAAEDFPRPPFPDTCDGR